jgi:hypothetical protein
VLGCYFNHLYNEFSSLELMVQAAGIQSCAQTNVELFIKVCEHDIYDSIIYYHFCESRHLLSDATSNELYYNAAP